MFQKFYRACVRAMAGLLTKSTIEAILLKFYIIFILQQQHQLQERVSSAGAHQSKSLDVRFCRVLR
jgi:hypothetical protein